MMFPDFKYVEYDPDAREALWVYRAIGGESVVVVHADTREQADDRMEAWLREAALRDCPGLDPAKYDETRWGLDTYECTEHPGNAVAIPLGCMDD